MASGWRAMTRDGGKPYDENFGFGNSFGLPTDVIGTLEQCYGMIWWLACFLEEGRSTGPVTRQRIQAKIEIARLNYKAGVQIGTDFEVPKAVTEDTWITALRDRGLGDREILQRIRDVLVIPIDVKDLIPET